MTLQQMEYIVAVDKYRHFAKAAESCGVTQSTLSSLIQKLEYELDVTIFDRSSHPVKPTELGKEIIKQARILLFNASQIEELVASYKGESGGKVRMGTTPTIAPYILPHMLRYLSENHPDIQLSAEESRVSDIVARLERGELDLALLATPVGNENLLEIPIYNERFVAYVSPEEEIYADKELDIVQLSPDNVWMLREAYCPNNGVFPFCHIQNDRQAVYEAGTIETLVRIVDENGGYTIIPELHIPLLGDRRSNVRYLRNPEPSREISFVVRRDYVREAILNIFANTIKEILPQSMITDNILKYPIRL